MKSYYDKDEFNKFLIKKFHCYAHFPDRYSNLGNALGRMCACACTDNNTLVK